MNYPIEPVRTSDIWIEGKHFRHYRQNSYGSEKCDEARWDRVEMNIEENPGYGYRRIQTNLREEHDILIILKRLKASLLEQRAKANLLVESAWSRFKQENEFFSPGSRNIKREDKITVFKWLG